MLAYDLMRHVYEGNTSHKLSAKNHIINFYLDVLCSYIVDLGHPELSDGSGFILDKACLIVSLAGNFNGESRNGKNTNNS
ncbi:MAG: hypothetical protein HOO87_03780 [Methyloglobulus sp.]|nr:hypothetical protein [Methyloglobulus sp.]